MPHKHKRDKSKNGPSYDLPPSSLAHALPVAKASFSTTSNASKSKSLPHKPAHKSTPADDTPRAFTRLMNYTTTRRKPLPGLDDGLRTSKKRKRLSTSAPANNLPPPQTATTTTTTTTAPLPTIHPSEPLSAFSARVDAALPVSNLTRSKRAAQIPGQKERQTKMEKRMQRMQKEWREGAKRRKEKVEDASEDEEEEEEGCGAVIEGEGKRKASAVGKKRKKATKKTKKKQAATDADPDNPVNSDSDTDPWVSITAKRLSSTQPTDTPNQHQTNTNKGLVGLHDVVLAPPKFSTVPREKFRGMFASGSGGLKRQGELGEARRKVVEGYRAMMKERRGGD